MSHVPVPPELDALVTEFMDKVKEGAAVVSSSGFGGKGLERLDKERDLVKKIQRKTHGGDLGDDEEEAEEEEKARKELEESFDAKVVQGVPEDDTAAGSTTTTTTTTTTTNGKVKSEMLSGLAKAREIVAGFSSVRPINDQGRVLNSSAFVYEIEINDYPQKARWVVTNKENISQIQEMSGAAITTRGSFFSPGTFVPAGKRKLYLVSTRSILHMYFTCILHLLFYFLLNFFYSILKAHLNSLLTKLKWKLEE
jgi:ATP-dependent RNA helicase DDX46/PRP5